MNTHEVTAYEYGNRSARARGSVLALAMLVAFGVWLRWQNLSFTVAVSNITSLLAPLAFASAVIETAIEIIISPWRDTFSMAASIVGVRALGLFLDSMRFRDASIITHAQQISFLCLDVALSSALRAGGADGIHSVVNAVTNCFDTSAEKTQS